MTRRKTVNTTGIPRLANIPYHDAWVSFTCISCKKINFIQIGTKLLDPAEAYENEEWACTGCAFVHSKDSDLPFENWKEEDRAVESLRAERFWKGFFRIATEHKDSYWKQCNVCGRILPYEAFSMHFGWGPLSRQMECRACKGAINAKLNAKRTAQQLHESSVRRRIADLLVEGENEYVNIDELFARFDSKCFKTGIPLDKNLRNTWAIDHVLPSKYLYALNPRNAALLSKDANSKKREQWPSKFYSNEQLVKLAQLIGADLALISSADPVVNTNINVNNCVQRYLAVRQASHLPKRISELKKIIDDNNLSNNLSDANKILLGY